jgi:LysM repeat protein
MCPEIKDLEALRKCIQDQIDQHPGYLIVSAAELFPEAGVLAGCVVAGAAPSFRVETPVLTSTATEVKVAGTATLFNSVAYTVAITGTVPQPNVVHLDMTLTAKDSTWTFGANFTNLPKYTGYNYTLRRVQRLESFFYDTVFNPASAGDPIFFASTYEGGPYLKGLSLDGLLDATKGAIGTQIGPYIPVADRPALPITGAIELRESTWPKILLIAPIEDLTISNLAGVSLELGTTDEEDPTFDEVGSSTCDLAGATTISGFPTIYIKGPALKGNYAWILTAGLKDPSQYTLGDGMTSLVNWVGGTTLTLPAGLDMFSSFYIDVVRIGLDPEPAAPSVNMLGITIRSTAEWVIPIVGFTIRDIGTDWRVVNPFDGPVLEGSVYGNIFIGGNDPLKTPRIAINIDLSGLTSEFASNVVIEAALDPKYPLNMGELFTYFTGVDLGTPLDALTVQQFDLRAETGPRSFFFAAQLRNEWQPLAPLFQFTNLVFELDYSSNSWSGSVTATIKLSTLPFQIGAQYRGAAKGWKFTGALQPAGAELTLGAFLVNLNPNWTVPEFIGNIALLGLSAWFDTLTNEFGFDTTVGWSYQIDGISIEPEAQFKLERLLTGTAPTQTLAYSGFVRGTLKINDFSISVIYNFGVQNNTSLTFEIRYGNLVLTCIYKKNAKGETIIRANLGGTSFGGILEYLVNLVDPDLGFRLTAPWDVLYEIKFDNLWLEANLTTKSVGITYELNLNLGFVNIKKLGLMYVNKAGQTTVDIIIEGDFLGTKYTEDDPLKWDLLNDPPPAPPGQAEQLLDLRYLGFGQNVTFRETKSFKSVRDVIVALEKDFLPVPDDQNPLVSLQALKFSPTGNWLIGADFTVMSAVSLSGIFNDPVLYGIRIGLAGPRVKSLAGLQFEILYKKITDTIGLYHLELTLPTAMRQIMLGPVAVTVPIIGIDIFTNGNFRLDFGFPTNRDFTRSFCVQGGPFIGYGGFYFGYLDGSTSEVVPKLANGNFAPVIEFGLGLSVGLGRTIDKGVLKAGLTLTLEAIIEGALAWFNPDDRSIESDFYYRIQGTAALVGKLYGEVDFVIIKASISVTAYASITLILEAYQPILIEVTVGVEVSASVKVLFITITFSFAMKLSFSFSIGSGGGAPWVIAAPDYAAEPLLLRGQYSKHTPRRVRPIEIFRRLRDANREQPVFDWMPRLVLEEPQTVPVMIMPAMTVAIPSATTMSLEVGTPLDDAPAVQFVMALFVETSTPSEAVRASDVRRMEVVEGAETVPFNILASGVFRWTVSSLQTNAQSIVYRSAEDEVTIAQLDAIACFLADRAHRDATFTYDRVVGLIEDNFVLRLSNPIGPSGGFFAPLSDTPLGGSGQTQSAIFPMIPEIEMQPQDAPPVKFWETACADPAYRAFLQTYYDQLAIKVEANVPKDPLADDPCADGPVSLADSGPLRASQLPPGCTTGTEPLSSIVFSDYFAMLSQQSVQAAVDMMNAYPYEATGSETLSDIVSAYAGTAVSVTVRRGDSIGTIAASFGVAAADVRARNPWLTSFHHGSALPVGSTVEVPIGPSVGTVAAANADYPLQYVAGNPVRMTITGVRAQVKSKQTLTILADAFGLSGPAAIITAEVLDSRGILMMPNATNVELLRGGSRFIVPAIDYTVTANDLVVPANEAFDRIAAMFYTRAGLRVLDAQQTQWVGWYQQAIADTNPDFAPGKTIKIPIAAFVEGQLTDTGNTTSYVVRDSDTLPWLAGMFELLQLEPADAGFVAFRGSITTTPPPPIVAGTVVHIPALVMTVNAGDTFASIAATFFIPLDLVPALTTLANANGASDILAALAVVAMPTLNYPIGENETLGSVASKLNLDVATLAQSVKNDAAIFAPYTSTETRMTIPDVVSRDLDELVADLIAFGAFNELSTSVSRFLLNGMRAPAPPQTDEPLWGLYDVLGQQFPAPTGVTGTYTIDFTKAAPGATWFCFDPPAGMRATTTGECADSLSVVLPDGFIQANAPSTTFDPQIAFGPTAMQLYNEVPPQYTIEQSIHWQSATQLVLPGPSGASGSGASGSVAGSAGEPSLWVFPQSLLQTINGLSGATAATPPYELVALQPVTGGGSTARDLTRYSWATAIPLTLTRAVNDEADFVPNAYQIVGADQSGRDLLLKAWSYLQSPGAPGAKLYLLYPPSAQNQNAKGLASDAVVGGRTFLLKTNLATETHSNAFAASMEGSAGDYYSLITSPGDFLQYIWEASITGTGGFYLNYFTEDGSGLPEQIFATDGSAELWAVLLLDTQTSPNAPDRALYPFNNCAVLAENLDSSALRLFAQLQSPAPDDLKRVASVPQGTIGFSMSRVDPTDFPGPTGLTENLYSLVGYQVVANDDFAASHEGLPISPLLNAPNGVPGATGLWYYQQIIPIAQFGEVNECPQSLAMPPAAENPYRGVTGPYDGNARPLSKANLALAFHDVYGNETVPTTSLAPFDAPVGYIDELIGVSSWPGTGYDYLFTPVQGTTGIALDTSLSLQIDRYLANAGNPFETVVRTANADAERYKQLFYQVQQTDLEFDLESNVGTPDVDIDDLKASLTTFVTKARLFSDTMRQIARTTADTQSESLGAFATRLSVSVQSLAVANKDADAAALFAGTYVKPVLMAAPVMNTLDALAKLAVGRDDAPDCNSVPTADPECTSAGVAGIGLVMRGEASRSRQQTAIATNTAVDPATIAANNLQQPLGPGVILRTNQRPPIALDPLFATGVANTLAGVAAAVLSAVYAEVPDPQNVVTPVATGLIWDNWTITQLVASGVTLTIQGVTVITDDASTFENLYLKFSETLTLTRGDYAVGIQDSVGIFRAQKSVLVANFVVPQPVPSTQPGPAMPTFSLADMATLVDTTNVPSLNSLTKNFFFSGSPIFLGYFCCKAGENETIATLAYAANVTVERFAQYNAVTTVNAGVTMIVPNLIQIPDTSTSWAPYSALPADSLDAIAAKFAGATAATLAEINRELPGIFAPGAQVTVGSSTLPAAPLDSLQSLYAQFASNDPNLTWENYVAALAPQTALYRPDGVIVTPLAKVPGTGSSPSFDAVAATFNVAAEDLLNANRALRGFLREGAAIIGESGKPPLTVSAYDTVDTIIQKYAALGITVTLETFLALNGGPNLMTAGATMLLAPHASSLTTAFAPEIPPAGASGENAIVFPVDVSVRMTRDVRLVDPSFLDSTAVYDSLSRLAPRISADTTQQLTLSGFADLFEQAFAACKLKCAVTTRSATEQPEKITQIFAVNFGAAGVRRFAVDPALPKYYAVKPLSTETFTGDVTFPRYVSGSGLCADVTKRYEAVDLDAWLQQFLETVDLFLTPPYSMPAFQLGATGMSAPRETASLPFLARPALGDGPIGFVDLNGLVTRPSFGRLIEPGASGCTGSPAPYGPDDFDRIVAAKQGIASALRESIWPIVQAPGATATYEWEAAREALYQQILVRLSDAYTVNAVVQFPVDVQSPVFTPPPGVTGTYYPPRTSGKVVPVSYSLEATAGANTIAAVALHYGVANGFLAEVIGNVQGLLLDKAAVSYGGKPYTIGPDDTINTVAAAFGIPTDPAATGYWEQWWPFIDAIAATAIFDPKANFQLSALKRGVYAGESLDDIAGFFGRDSISVARANQNVAGIFIPQSLTVAPYPNPYSVQATDDLSQIAAGISAANPAMPPLTVDMLAAAERQSTSVLQSGVTLRLVTVLPDMSISTSKVSMGRVGSVGGAPPPLSFLLTVKHASEMNKILLNLNYAINEIEYAIRNVDGAGSYQASQWLTLVLPIGSGYGVDVGVETSIEQVQIPIPLRAYPPPSALLRQNGDPSYPDDPVIANARKWNYSFDVETRKAAQDTDHIEVTFGEQQGMFMEAAAVSPNLIKWLAAFVDAYPSLRNDLAILTTLTPGAQNDTAAYAVSTLSWIAQQIGASFGGAMFDEEEDSMAVDTYGYQMTMASDGLRLRTLDLQIEEGPVGPSAVYPQLYVQQAGASGATGFVPMPGASGSYEFPAGDYYLDAPHTYRFLFETRDVIRSQSGRGAISVTRNENLIAHGPLGPTGSPDAVPTSPDFIYRTPQTKFVNALIPLVDNDARIDISQMSPAPLSQYIESLLAAAIDVVPGGFGPSQYIEMLASYGFALNDAALVATTQIRLVPSLLVGGSTVASFAASLSNSLNEWYTTSGVDPSKGMLVFELSVFTQVAPASESTVATAHGVPVLTSVAGATGTPLKPILRLRNVQLQMSKINWGITAGPSGLTKDEHGR